jgi:signal peptidase II
VWLLFLIILFLDRLTKYFVSKILLVNQGIPVIKNIFHFTIVHNTGAAFGIFKNKNYLFIVAALFATVFIYFKLRQKRTNKLLNISLVLILAGTIGNLIDRISFGYVIDFLDFRIWPVFNIADSSITVGAILLGYALLKSRGSP